MFFLLSLCLCHPILCLSFIRLHPMTIIVIIARAMWAHVSWDCVCVAYPPPSPHATSLWDCVCMLAPFSRHNVLYLHRESVFYEAIHRWIWAECVSDSDWSNFIVSFRIVRCAPIYLMVELSRDMTACVCWHTWMGARRWRTSRSNMCQIICENGDWSIAVRFQLRLTRLCAIHDCAACAIAKIVIVSWCAHCAPRSRSYLLFARSDL